jgi:hypothetical protein
MRRLAAALVFVVVFGFLLLPSASATAGSRLVAAKSLKSWLVLATRGVSGSFSEVYQVSGVEEGGTVHVAQRAPPGHPPFVTGAGSWSFQYQNHAGYSSQWVESGETTSDCWRPPGATQWTCSGPGQFRYVNGYLMAVSPYVPGDVLGAINQLKGALTSKLPQIEKIVAKRTLFASTSHRFGPLRCLNVAGNTTCLDRLGVVVSSSGGKVFGSAVTLLRYSSSAPKSAFSLKGTLPPSGLPFVALHQPYVL